MISFRKFGPLVGAIDEGTSSARFLVFAADTAELLTYHQIETSQTCPKEGWVEQDPYEILNAVRKCIEKTVENLCKLDIDPRDITAIGLTNQRETVVIWDKTSGKPLYNAIVWLDTRNKDTVDNFLKKTKGFNADHLKYLCGLPISTYFSALKLRWLIDNVPDIRVAIKENRCCFGNIDSWLIWNLTGGTSGGIHITDVTNASRTMLMNIYSLKWDPVLLKFFDIPVQILPQIRSSSEIYGYLIGYGLHGTPISGCLGDQQAALVGQMCLKPGQAKNTYGTGCFLLYNTGTTSVWSNHGLLTTIAYQLGPKAPVIYALEGSVAVAGAALTWLQNNMQILNDISELKNLTIDNPQPQFNNVYFVPAFSGLYAPYWRKDARSIICGITRGTTKTDIIKSVLEAVCFQTRDILEAMHLDCGESSIKTLLVDGGMSNNDYLMQLQSDLIGIPVLRPTMTETSALGAAMAAGSAEGINVWDLYNIPSASSDTFLPTISDDERDIKYSRWKMAINRSFGWDTSSENSNSLPKCPERKMSNFIPASLFIMTIFGLIMLSQHFQNLRK